MIPFPVTPSASTPSSPTPSPAGAGEAADSRLASAVAAAALTVARRFAAGATLWAVAPETPWHARHLAVEFVHPVIVGTRALPAVAIDGHGAVAAMRALARPGDLLAVISSGSDPVGLDLLRRAPTWGLVALAVLTGPASVEADYVIPAGAGNDDVVRSYHLLWELTHVVFEHPGLLEQVEEACEETVCVTCGDEARVAEVQALAGGRADVLVGGEREVVDVSLLEEVSPGSLVLVHAGVALGALGEEPVASPPEAATTDRVAPEDPRSER